MGRKLPHWFRNRPKRRGLPTCESASQRHQKFRNRSKWMALRPSTLNESLPECFGARKWHGPPIAATTRSDAEYSRRAGLRWHPAHGASEAALRGGFFSCPETPGGALWRMERLCGAEPYRARPLPALSEIAPRDAARLHRGGRMAGLVSKQPKSPKAGKHVKQLSRGIAIIFPRYYHILIGIRRFPREWRRL